jgi:probable F420-dependent oxidoreductase
MPPSSVPEGSLVYGIQLPIQSLTEAAREPWEVSATVDDLAAVAVAADQAGCAFVGVCDHIAIPDNDYARRMNPTWYDTVATMGFIAAHTSRVGLLSAVYIAAYRHPLSSAKAFMTLDHLSGGRVVLGVGAGHVEAEFDALGIDFATRGQRLDEAIDAIRDAFASTYTKFSGTYFKYEEIGLAPRPKQQRIPIWVGGSSKPALRRVAERGDGWIPQGTPVERMQESVDYIRARRDLVRPGAPLDLGFRPPPLYIGQPSWDVGPATVSGSPERVVESLLVGRNFGCTVLHLSFRSRGAEELCDQLASFGRDVAPLLAQGG